MSQAAATDAVATAGAPARLELVADRDRIAADGRDLSFLTVRVLDAAGRVVPTARDRIRFRIEGPGEIVATDNGDATDMTAFPSRERNAFSGMALAIIRALPAQAGTLTVHAEADGLHGARATVTAAPAPRHR